MAAGDDGQLAPELQRWRDDPSRALQPNALKRGPDVLASLCSFLEQQAVQEAGLSQVRPQGRLLS